MRRTRLADQAEAALFPGWRHHSFLTDFTADTSTLDRFHRHHAVVELAIRDLKENSGLDHIPSGLLAANGAWLACAVLAHRGDLIMGFLSTIYRFDTRGGTISQQQSSLGLTL